MQNQEMTTDDSAVESREGSEMDSATNTLEPLGEDEEYNLYTNVDHGIVMHVPMAAYDHDTMEPQELENGFRIGNEDFSWDIRVFENVTTAEELDAVVLEYFGEGCKAGELADTEYEGNRFGRADSIVPMDLSVNPPTLGSCDVAMTYTYIVHNEELGKAALWTAAQEPHFYPVDYYDNQDAYPLALDVSGPEDTHEYDDDMAASLRFQ